MKRISLLTAILLILTAGRSQSTLHSAFAISNPSFVNSLPASFTNPDSNMNYQNNGAGYALVAGGSKGIGYAIAEALARRGYNLILIARHMDSLISAKNKLEYDYHIHVEVLAYDLSFDDAALDIAKWCTERNIPLKMLCNVAGFGGARDYLSLSLDSLRYMINLNIGSAM
ncbi:MAG TPA: SDR family NAD(P)-dependent oxidoreductase, partial [Puia sp.]|nr:SDR family NAD(P)-dependent oxidoreductase [Puia sp.]